MDVVGLESGVAAIAIGHNHVCALTTAGGVECWGDDFHGQLGNGKSCGTFCTTPVEVTGLGSGVVAIAAGGEHTCAITASGGLKCWGRNAFGQLGDGTMTSHSTPVDVAGLASGVAAVEGGGQSTCAITSLGGLKCWGRNTYGQVGDGTTASRITPAGVTGLGSGVAAVSKGIFHTCALTTGGGLKCWGRNEFGQLGDGTTTNHSVPGDVTGLTAGVGAVGSGGGGEHTCAITTGGGAKCWGRNDWGQVGDGTTTDRLTPTDVVGLGTGVAAVSEGSFHTCALMTSGGAKCWGANSTGQLALLPPLGPETCGDTASCSKTPIDIGKGPPPTPTATPCSADCPTPTSTPVPKGSHVVNSTLDANDISPGNGVCAISGGACTLRAAIQEVNANPGPDVIVPGGTFFLTAGPLVITADLTLNGAGALATVIDGGGIGRVLEVASGATVEMSGVRFRNGLHTIGGGIRNDGDLTLNDVTVDANSASLRAGGIVNEGGNLTLNDSTVSGNTAGVNGGGIRNVGMMTINNSEISGNTGGGITNRYAVPC